MVDESTRHRRRGWRRTVPRLSQFALEHLLLLPLGVTIALAWANLFAESYFRFSYAAVFAVNDVAMVFFFAVMTKEVVEATAPGGVLHSWRRVLMPVIASFGVALVPALVHLALVEPLDEPMLGVAWAGDARDRRRGLLSRRPVDLRALARRYPVCDPAGDCVRCDRLRGACAPQS